MRIRWNFGLGQVIEDLILIYHVMSADEVADRVIFL